MRRFPSSWDRTLAALGFRRNVKKVKRDLYRRKQNRIEPLEERAMLHGAPLTESELESLQSIEQPAIALATASPLLGDANGDSQVDFTDLEIVATNRGLTSATYSDGDFDGDGVVGLSDWQIASFEYAMSYALQVAAEYEAANSSGIALATAIDTSINNPLASSYNVLNDVDRDGDFDLADLNKIGSGYGKTIEEAGFVGDGIGKINSTDLMLLGIESGGGRTGELQSSDIALASAPPVEPHVFIPGDANKDGVVDLADLNLIGSNWDPPPELGATREVLIDGDFDGDGYVGLADLNILGSTFGTTALPVPPLEPSISISLTDGIRLQAHLGEGVDETYLANNTFTYQWQRDNEDIPGATNEYYEVVDSESGSQYSVIVTSVNGGHTTNWKLSAPVIFVNSLSDAGDDDSADNIAAVSASSSAGREVTLRAAIEHINDDLVGIEMTGTPTVVFSESLGTGQTIELDSALGQLTLSQDIDIIGPGANLLTIDANASAANPNRLLKVNHGVVATIAGLSLTGAHATANGDDLGGAIYLDGASLTLRETEVSGNTAADTGGIYATNSSSLEIEQSTIAENVGLSSRGGVSINGSVLNLINSTVSGNLGNDFTSGIAVFNSSTATINNSTIAYNIVQSEATEPADSAGRGGLYVDINSSASATLYNSIVAGNYIRNSAGTNTYRHEIDGDIANGSSHNLIGYGDGSGTSSTGGVTDDRDGSLGNIVLGSMEDAKLGDLRYNGGRTRTHALLTGSLAIDAGINAQSTGTTDQRGQSRIVDAEFDGVATIDIGSYEAPTGTGTEDTLIVDVIVRDFHASDWNNGEVGVVSKGHPDFQSFNGNNVTTDLVTNRLGPDGKPVFSSITGSGSEGEQLTGKEEFDVWYSDDPTYNKSLVVSARLTKDSGTGLYEFEKTIAPNGQEATPNNYFPIDGLLFNNPNDLDYEDTSNAPGNHNFHFTTQIRAEFTYKPNQSLKVIQSDDDLWLYINGQLVVDLGGLHPARDSPEILLDNLLDDPSDDPADPNSQKLIEGKTYHFDLFHAERATAESNFKFQTSIDDLRTRENEYTLSEDDRLVSEKRYDISDLASAIEIPFSSLNFDPTGNTNGADVNDAFEIAILDAQGTPLRTPTLGTIESRSDALFNFTQGQLPVWGNGVELLDNAGNPISSLTTSISEGRVYVDLSDMPAGDYEVVARLLNNDADNLTEVNVPKSYVKVVAASSAPLSNSTYPEDAQATRPRFVSTDYASLQDVTRAFDIEYKHTTLDAIEPLNGLNTIRTRFDVTKEPGLQVRNDLLVAIKPPTPQGGTTPGNTRLVDYDGVLPYEVAGLPAGTPFIRLTGLMDTQNRFYEDGASISNVELAFEHEGTGRFDYELVVLGQLNDPPIFTSNPYGTLRGDAYPVDYLTQSSSNPAQALEIIRPSTDTNTFSYRPTMLDPNGDYTHIQLIAGPVGMTTTDSDGDGRDEILTWDVTPSTDLGPEYVTIRAIDEHGAYDPANDQKLLVNVLTGVDNRPPYFTTPPNTSATYGTTYSYSSNAFDPDGHDLDYTVSLGSRPVEYTIPYGELTGFTGQMDYLTFFNDSSIGDGVSMFSGIRVYESDQAGEPQTLYFNHQLFEDYTPTSGSGTVQVTGDGSVIRLAGDGRFAYQLATPYTVSANTVLEFIFSSEQEGDAHGIGLDTQTGSSETAESWFQVYGMDDPTSTSANDGSPSADMNWVYDPNWSEVNDMAVDNMGQVTWNAARRSNRQMGPCRSLCRRILDPRDVSSGPAV